MTAAEPTYETMALRHDHPAVVRLHQAYRDRYGFGPRPLAYGIDCRWWGVAWDGRVVAVFSERDVSPGILEVQDAYAEPSRVGREAFLAGCLRYRGLLERGVIGRLRHAVLWKNKAFWRKVIAVMGEPPVALLFEHRVEDHRGTSGH